MTQISADDISEPRQGGRAVLHTLRLSVAVAVLCSVSLGIIVALVLLEMTVAPGTPTISHAIAPDLIAQLGIPIAIGLAGAICAGLIALPLARRVKLRQANRVWLDVADRSAATETLAERTPPVYPNDVEAELDVQWSEEKAS